MVSLADLKQSDLRVGELINKLHVLPLAVPLVELLVNMISIISFAVYKLCLAR